MAANGAATTSESEFHSRKWQAQIHRTITEVVGRDSFSADEKVIGVLTSGGDSQGGHENRSLIRQTYPTYCRHAIEKLPGKYALTWPKLLTLLNDIFSMLMYSLHHSPSDQVQNGRIFVKKYCV